MNTKFVISLPTLPEEGRWFEGELSEKVFDLPDKLAVPEGGIHYRLHALVTGAELLLRGHLRAEFRLQCVASLEYFPHTVEFPDFTELVPVTGSEVDLTELLREEILLGLPSYPRKPGLETEDLTGSPPETKKKTTESKDHRWDALDTLEIPDKS